jgi:hypothetical protein
VSSQNADIALIFSLSFEWFHRVLRFTFSGLFTTDGLDAIDPALVHFLAALSHDRQSVRYLFDMAQQALAVSQARFQERTSKSAIGDLMRVVVAPSWAGADFGRSYRQASGRTPSPS